MLSTKVRVELDASLNLMPDFSRDFKGVTNSLDSIFVNKLSDFSFVFSLLHMLIDEAPLCASFKNLTARSSITKKSREWSDNADL